LTDTH